MNHLSEDSIEELARASAESDTPVPPNAEAHFGECSVCREKYAYFRQYYSTLNDELSTPLDAEILNLIEGNTAKKIIPLRRYEPGVAENGIHLRQNVTLMAALEKKEEGEKFSTVATFVAEKETLLRVVRDSANDQYTVYLLTSDDSLREACDIIISDQRGNILNIRPDHKGAALVDNANSIDWKTATVALATH
ncbi:MAG: hypothetical protein V1799_18315 [bacterium]